MKKLLLIGKPLTEKEQKQISGGQDYSGWWNDPSISDHNDCHNGFREIEDPHYPEAIVYEPC